MIALLAAQAFAFPLVPIQIAGDTGTKYDIVIVSEGYAATDMAKFASDADQIVQWMVGDCPIAGACPLAERASAFNFYRLEVPSTDSGVQDGYMADLDGDPKAVKEAFVATTPEYRTAFGQATAAGSGCWFATTGDAEYDLPTVLAADAPQLDSVLLLLNTTAFGGCNGGTIMTITTGENAGTYRHEFGHNLGSLGDEYQPGTNTAYDKDSADAWRAAAPNLSTSADRAKLPWADFVDPSTTVPAAPGGTAVSAYEGGGAAFDLGVWRPVTNGTMAYNTDDFGAPNHHRMMGAMTKRVPSPFANLVFGQFAFAEPEDLLVHQSLSLQSFATSGPHFSPVELQTRPFPGWDSYAPNDRFAPGDFDGDGMDDLFVINGDDFEIVYAGLLLNDGNAAFDLTVRWDGVLSGWGSLARHDAGTVGDFDGDGRADVFLHNAVDWAEDYAGVAYSRGAGLEVTQYYVNALPGWQMSAGDQFRAADVDGDGADEVVVWNVSSWLQGYLGVFRVAEGQLVPLARYDGVLEGWDAFAPHDEVHLADMDGDGAQDLVLFNAVDWIEPYIGVFHGDASGFSLLARHDGEVYGWDALALHDLLTPGDVDGDGCGDLAIANGPDWIEPYVGQLLGDCAGGLSGWWNTGAELGLALTTDTWLHAAEITGDARDDLVLGTDDRQLVRLRSEGIGWTTQAIYVDWITNYPYHSSGWW